MKMLFTTNLNFYLALLCLPCIIRGYSIEFKDGSPVNQVLTGTVSSERQIVYRFPISGLEYTNDTLLRVEVHATIEANIGCPVHFIIRQVNEVQDIDLPQQHQLSNTSLYSGARTLCMDPREWAAPLFVSVSTCNRHEISYSFTLHYQNDFFIRIGIPKTVKDVSSTAPALFKFHFPPDVNWVVIHTNSTTKSKTFVSIQQLICPVRDLLTNVRNVGQWHTMSRITSLIVRRDNQFSDGFLLLFLPDGKGTNDGSLNYYPDTETISFVVRANTEISSQKFILSITVPLFIFILLIAIVYCTYSYHHHRFIRHGGEDDEVTPENFQCFCYPTLFDTNLRVLHFAEDTNLYKYLKANSYRYIWTILTIVFFYGLPVILLSNTLSKFASETGNIDTCHFNYRCAYPVWIFMSFNNVYSCIGFVLLGISFMAFVHCRAKSLSINEGGFLNFRQEDPTESWNCCRLRKVYLGKTGYGAYQHFGTYYALGFALAMAGLMKMSYTTCPNRDTTFFGLTFMFIIVLLCQIKIYNLRHPCMVTDNFTFISIGLIMGAVTAGYLVNIREFQIVISVIISFLLQLTSWILHSAGYVTTDANKIVVSPHGLFRNVFLGCNFRPLFKPETLRRMCWPILRLLANCGILAFIWLFMIENHFTSRMYILALTNLVFDFFYYYVILKCCHREYSGKISWQPVAYLVCAIGFWTASLIYLTQSIVAWELPSILLQEFYRGCKVGIYDVLDMYHWTCALAWFFTFMLMLTADDHLSRTSIEMSPVF